MRNLTLTLLLMLALLSCACTPAGATATEDPEAGIENLLGTYAFEKQLYMNPLSSFMALDGFREYYTFTDEAFVITDFEGNRYRRKITYQEASVDAEAFRESFMLDWLEIPDLSAYQNRLQYTMTDESDPDRFYRLYLLDNDLWLAQVYRGDANGIKSEYIWSIFKIKRFQGDLPLKTSLYGTQDGVDAFLALQTDFVSGYDNDECFNVTPDTIRYGNDYSVFKYNQSCASFLLYENEIYPMGEWFGGYGVTSMAQADCNRDGLYELYFTYSWGSGLHRACAACFDPGLKEIIPIDFAGLNGDGTKISDNGFLNGEIIVAPNQRGGFSLYSASIASIDSFVKMELEKTGLLADIQWTDGTITLVRDLAE